MEIIKQRSLINKTDHGKWLLSDWIGENALLKLATINIEMKMSDLYHKVKFDEI